jgi:hypothetical protein
MCAKITNKMGNMEEKAKNVSLPRHGFINGLAKLCACSRHTVRRAIYENGVGGKCEMVRKMYRTMYGK